VDNKVNIYAMASMHGESSKQTDGPATDPSQNDFHYTNVYYITRRNMWHPEIKIHDITSSVTVRYPSKEFKTAAYIEGEARANSVPEWIVLNYGFRKTASLHTGSTTASTKGDENLIATWEPSKQQYDKNRFVFPTGSTHCGHTVVMNKEKKWTTFDEMFVVESISYFWRYEGHTRKKFKLWKVVGHDKRLVARYKRNKWRNKRGGVLLVNNEEVDCALAVMTIMAMLRKVRQRG
jgi:hypothetical protein